MFFFFFYTVFASRSSRYPPFFIECSYSFTFSLWFFKISDKQYWLIGLATKWEKTQLLLSKLTKIPAHTTLSRSRARAHTAPGAAGQSHILVRYTRVAMVRGARLDSLSVRLSYSLSHPYTPDPTIYLPTLE